MQQPEDGADAAVESLLEVQLQVDADDDLAGHEEEQGCGGDRVDILRIELPAAVQVAERVAEEGEGGADDL
jgi:hypothetical protein